MGFRLRWSHGTSGEMTRKNSTENHGRDLGNISGQPDGGAGEAFGKETCIAGLRRQGPCAQDPAGGGEPRLEFKEGQVSCQQML